MITTKITSLGQNATTTNRALIIGAQNTGKTSLAFRLAYESAENGGCPLFICNQAKLESKLPLTVHCNSDGSVHQVRMSSDILSRIQMKYVTSMNELKAVIAGLHGFSPIPTTLIIDDLSLLIDPLHSVPRGDPKFLDICLSLGAYMDDVLNFLCEKSVSNTVKLQLVVTDSCEEAGFVHMLQKNVHSVAKIVKANNADYYSLVAMSADSRGKTRGGNGTNSVLLPKIEFAEGQLFVSCS